MLAVAVFEATSVIDAVMIQMMSIIANGGSTSNWVNRCPSQRDSPDTFEASDKANPAPDVLKFNIRIIQFSVMILLIQVILI